MKWISNNIPVTLIQKNNHKHKTLKKKKKNRTVKMILNKFFTKHRKKLSFNKKRLIK